MDIDMTRTCPHCKETLQTWAGPPETGWGILLVCNNHKCSYYQSSNDCVAEFNPEAKIGFRYAEDPDNGYTSFNLAAYCGETFMELNQPED